MVRRQGVRAESNVGAGGHAATVLTDLRKYDEYIDHEQLLRCCEETGFPMPLARVAINAYGGGETASNGRLCGRQTIPMEGNSARMWFRNHLCEGIYHRSPR